MKIVRVSFALSLSLLAAPPAFAAVALPPPPKPPADAGSAFERNSWRGQAIGICVADLGGPDELTADELEANCGCAVDRFMAGQRGATLQPIARGETRTTLGGELIACASEQRPAVAAALARRLAEPPSTLPQALDSKPPADSAAAPAEAPKRTERSFSEWFGSLSLPDWLTGPGLPTWAWAILGAIAFLLIRGLFRRDDRRDLAGPPRSMHLGQRVSPAPRAADPPQRS